MKLIIVALALVAAVAAAPPQEPWKILRSDFNQQPDGPYNTAVETENGIVLNEAGELKQVPGEDNKPANVIVVRGSYEYKDDQGQLHKVDYYADETGFHAESADIPVAARR